MPRKLLNVPSTESASKPPQNDGLALPVRSVHVAQNGGFNFGWCLVDANERVLAPYLTQRQAQEMSLAINCEALQSRAGPEDDGGTTETHARYWRRHVQMLRRNHRPHIVEQLLEAVKKYDEEQRPATGDTE